MRKGKKPIKKEAHDCGVLYINYRCPVCNEHVGLYDSTVGMCYKDKFCFECKQEIDWSVEDA